MCSNFGTRDHELKLFAIDAFRVHNTSEVMESFNALKTTVSLSPRGCTGFVQVLDVALNQPMKMLIKQEANDHYNAHIQQQTDGKYTIRERRVMLTHWVARAQKRLHIEYKETIVKAFRSVDMSLNPNGSEDFELKIKALDDVIVGDWHRQDILQDNEQEDVTAQLIYKVEEACQNGTIQVKVEAETEEEYTVELGITKANLQASNAQKSNRYYLQEDTSVEGSSEATEGSNSELSMFESDDGKEEALDHHIDQHYI